ncbi:hypothetical protein ACFE04_018821 [Oxalis oulophora]
MSMSINGDIVDTVAVSQNVVVDDHADKVNGNSALDEEQMNENFYDARGINNSEGDASREEAADDAESGETCCGTSRTEAKEIKENIDDDVVVNGSSTEIEENIDDDDVFNGTSGGVEDNIDDAGNGTSGEEDEETESNDEVQDPVKLLSLPSDEVLEREFHCAYQKIFFPDEHGKIFLQEGRLCIFTHFVCFHGEFLGQKVKHKIPSHLITSVSTKQRRGIFPNSMEIIADDEVFLFATTSDEAFRLIKDKWQKNLNNDNQTISEELASYPVSYSSSVSTPSWTVEDVDAPKISENYKKVSEDEDEFSMTVEGFFRLFFSDTSRWFQDALHDEDPDFKCSRWRPHVDFGYARDMSSKHEFDGITEESFTGKYKEVQKFRVYRNSHLVLTTSQEICDESNDEHYFDVKTIWDVQRASDEDCEDSCICKVYVHVTIIKTDFGEGNVEQSIIDDYKNTYEKWIDEARDERDSIKDLEGLESGIVRANIIKGESQFAILDKHQKVLLKCEFETDDDDKIIHFEDSLVNLAKKLNYREEFVEAFVGLKLGSRTAMLIPPTIRNSTTYTVIYFKLKGIGDKKIEEDSSDSEAESEAESEALEPKVSNAVLPDPKYSESANSEKSQTPVPSANTSYLNIAKSLVVGTVVACSVSVIMGMTRAKKTKLNSQMSSGIVNTPSMDLTQERDRHPAEIMYQVITVGEGNGITKYQPGCFMYRKTGSIEPTSFEGSPTDLAIKLARGYEEAIGSITPDEGSIITRLEEAIVGMKVNERRKITIPPVVSCLREVLHFDLTLTSIKEPPRKNNLLELVDFHAIQIPEELGKSWPERCIHDIPKNLRDVNPTAYTPQLISIGPLHRARPELANMEKHKFYYAKNFLDRTQKQKVLFVNFIQEREQSIRGSYIKPSDLSSRDYVEMILLDSFFIFELFIRCQKKTDIEYADDSLLHELWYKNNLLLDLLLFENQLPFCLLSELYRFSFDNAKDPECFTFVHLCLTYFTVFNHKQIMLQEDECKKQLHFTGLVRRFNCREPDERKESKNSPSLKYAAKKLSESRVKFYGIHDGSLTDISFKKRVFKLPRFKIDNTTERICRNLMGLEQHQFKDNAYICSYIKLLHLLMQTSDDVAVLVEDGVIVNGLDNNQAVVDLFSKLCKNITINNFYFSGICEKLTDYRSSWKGWWNICRKVLKDGYFTDIWRGTGTVAAVILLLLTLVQTITSILQVTAS